MANDQSKLGGVCSRESINLLLHMSVVVLSYKTLHKVSFQNVFLSLTHSPCSKKNCKHFKTSFGLLLRIIAQGECLLECLSSRNGQILILKIRKSKICRGGPTAAQFNFTFWGGGLTAAQFHPSLSCTSVQLLILGGPAAVTAAPCNFTSRGGIQLQSLQPSATSHPGGADCSAVPPFTQLHFSPTSDPEGEGGGSLCP